jgi:RNA polymerase sigma-70 factor (ECF subfamily)
MDEKTDEQLYDAYRDGGDERALASLVERRWETCYRLALGVLHDPAAAEDAAQLALVKLVSAARRRESLGAVGGWLATTVVNEARMQRRAATRREKHEEKAAAVRPVESAPTSSCVAELTEALPEKLKVPLELHFGLGLTHGEVGSLLGWPVGTVSTRIREGLASIREQLAGAGVATAAVTIGTLLSAARAEAREAALPAAPDVGDLGRGAPTDAPWRAPSRFTLGAPIVVAAAAAVAVTGLLASSTSSGERDAPVATAPVVTDVPVVKRPPLTPPAPPRPSDLLVPPGTPRPAPGEEPAAPNSPKAPASSANAKSAASEKQAGAVEVTSRHLFWTITKNDVTLYLLGSVPANANDLLPLPAEIEQAYEKSDALVVLYDLQALDASSLPDALLTKGFSASGDTLARHVSVPTLNRLEEYCNAADLRPAELEGMSPWLAALFVEEHALRSQKITPDHSLEHHFLEKARNPLKQVHELAKPSDELRRLSDLAPDLQEALLGGALDDAGRMKELLASFREAWSKGDANAVEKLAHRAGESSVDTRLDKALRVDRAALLAERLKSSLLEKKERASYFVVLDAELLVGKDGLLEQLQVEWSAMKPPRSDKKTRK